MWFHDQSVLYGASDMHHTLNDILIAYRWWQITSSSKPPMSKAAAGLRSTMLEDIKRGVWRLRSESFFLQGENACQAVVESSVTIIRIRDSCLLDRRRIDTVENDDECQTTIVRQRVCCQSDGCRRPIIIAPVEMLAATSEWTTGPWSSTGIEKNQYADGLSQSRSPFWSLLLSE